MEMVIGADYYPEHWPRERWEEDARLMRKAGFNTTRLTEFSWVKLEPKEGQYNFQWLDDAIGVLGRRGIRSILCTPTPTMPKWVYDQYPEAVARDRDGHLRHFGNRQNNCFSSDTYRRLSRNITTALAERYADNPYVIGWQLDNELSVQKCFCESCENAFRHYLEDKFGTVEVLNEAYGTIFWSQSYGNIGEIHLPRHERPNPSLYLDHCRFHSDLLISFAKEQADILRRICPEHFITHNYMGFAPHVNYYNLGKLLDFVSQDYYYNLDFWDERFSAYVQGAAALDLMRGCKGKNFYIMENSAGPVGWETYGRNIRPGEMRRMTFHNMAHGADGQIWFRWRTCRYGTEQYWHGILGHDGIPSRRYTEAAQTAADLQKVWTELENSTIQSDIAIIYDYSDYWALTQQSNNRDFEYIRAFMPYYRALYRRGVNVDFINSEVATDRYKVIILPHKYILTREYAEKLNRFVKNGGMLLTTCRCGVKNCNNVPLDMTLPGYLRDITGIRVEEYETVQTAKPYTVEMNGEVYEGTLLADWIIPETAEVLARFAVKDTGYPAVTRNTCGDGCVYYIGTVPCDRLADRIISSILDEAGIRRFELPEHTEAMVRSKDGVDYVFMINHTLERQTFPIDGIDLLTGLRADGSLILEPNGVAVIRLT